MKHMSLSDLRAVRKALGKSQAELAQMLGASRRAVQSYEQGWRRVPRHVQKMAGLLLYLRRRKRRAVPPCWKVRRCPDEIRRNCPAHQLDAGELCWLVSGNMCREGTVVSAGAKMAKCQRCAVVRRWLAA